MAINGYSVTSASGSLLEDYYNNPYPFSMYLMNTEYEIDAGNINSPIELNHSLYYLNWQFDTFHGTQDLVFYYGTSEGTFQGVVNYSWGYMAGGGSGGEFDAALVQEWVQQLDPQVLDEVARFVAERQSSASTPAAAAVDELLKLLLADAA